ncbi:Protein BCCIP like [Pseudolycoriella hygida]|uniref:Protein BCCIP homolog n=1 Tax=Pseudolycoriella hygida TaxID=35572 RepID=A0A9Q0RYK8_9DIPT|nr:Protein BCCIP like [Pseudolycoriella hygida]
MYLFSTVFKMPLKKRAPNENEMEVSDHDSSDSSDPSDFNDHNEEIQVDFEGRMPIDSDFHGIRQLLTQLFPQSNINLQQLADYIIGQNYVGSVVVQSEDDEDEDDDDVDMDDENVVFGFTTAINLMKTDVDCIKEVRNFLQEIANEKASDDLYEQLESIFDNPSNVVGFLLNERYINIPPQISVPLLESLVKEVAKAVKHEMPFKFTHYIMLLKFYKMSNKKDKGKVSPTYLNGEEEIFVQYASLDFDFAVHNESESDDGENVPFRKVIVFEASKLPLIIESIKMFIE